MSKVRSAAEFSNAWGSGGLVRLLKSSPHLPLDASEFLRTAGLPKALRLAHPSGATVMSFSKLSGDLERLTESGIHGERFPDSWREYWILGEDRFDNGCADIVVDRRTGHVLRVDVELKDPESFLNSSVPQFASTLLALVTWSDGGRALPELKEELGAIDPRVFEEPTAYWQLVLDELADVGPAAFRFLKG